MVAILEEKSSEGLKYSAPLSVSNHLKNNGVTVEVVVQGSIEVKPYDQFHVHLQPLVLPRSRSWFGVTLLVLGLLVVALSIMAHFWHSTSMVLLLKPVALAPASTPASQTKGMSQIGPPVLRIPQSPTQVTQVRVKGFVAEASQIDRAKTGSAVADDLSLDDEAYTKTQTTPLAEDVNAVDVADRNPRHFVRSAAESVSVSDSATRLLAAQRSSTDSN